MKRKLMTGALIVAMMAILVAGASLAYFTDTETANNTFTLGNVNIILTEPEYDKNGGNNNAVVMPGKTIPKDPTITVESNSQDCYLFVEIDWSRYVPYIDNAIKLGIISDVTDLAENTNREAFFDAYVEGFNHSDWKIMNADEIISVLTNHKDGDAWPEYLNIKLGYKGSVSENGVLEAGDIVKVFSGIKMPANSTQDTMKLFYEYDDGTPKEGDNVVVLNITAHAIQADQIADLDAAYAALFPSTSN